MTAADITTTVRIYFSHRGVKLFKNEPHKKLVNKVWRYIKDLGYPPGSPDLMGWNTKTGVVFGVEVKTLNDTLSKTQIDILNMMVKDKCQVYVAKEMKYGNIMLTDWKTNEAEVIGI